MHERVFGRESRFTKYLNRDIIDPLSLAVAIFIVWEGAVHIFNVPTLILPAPTRIYTEFVAFQSIFIDGMAASLQWILISFVVGSAVGMALAIMTTYSKLLRDMMTPVTVIAFVVPKIVIAPLLLFWFGASPIYWIGMPVLLVFFPVFENTVSGFKGVEADLLDLSRSYKGSSWFAFRHVRIPHAIPHIMAGLKIGVREAVIGVIIAEFIAKQAGIGYTIILGENFANTSVAMTGVILTGVLGIVTYKTLEKIENHVVYWKSVEVAH